MLDLQMRQPTTLAEVISYVRALEDQLRYALSNIDGQQITEGTVGQNQLAQGAVGKRNIATGAVNGDALEGGTVSEDKLADAVLKDIDKKINDAGSSLVASNDLKNRVNSLIALAEINWHKIVDEDGQLMTADGGRIRFERLAISADNLRGIGEGQLVIRSGSGLYAITATGTDAVAVTASAVTEAAMADIADAVAQGMSAEVFLGRADVKTEMAEQMPAALIDREDIIAKINALIDAKMETAEGAGNV